MGDDLTQQLRLLLAKQEITEAVHDYCHCVDTCSFDELVALFTEDATLDYGRGALFTGREALSALFRDRLVRYTATNHHCSTTKFTALDEERASTVSYIYAFHDSPDPAVHIHVWGHYEDEWAREGDRWLLTERRIRVAGTKTTPRDDLPERFEPYARH